MKRLSIFVLALALIVGGVFAVMAEDHDYIQHNFKANVDNGTLDVHSIGDNYVKFFNDIDMDTGTVDIYQDAGSHVVMANEVDMEDGYTYIDSNAENYVHMQNNLDIGKGTTIISQEANNEVGMLNIVEMDEGSLDISQVANNNVAMTNEISGFGATFDLPADVVNGGLSTGDFNTVIIFQDANKNVHMDNVVTMDGDGFLTVDQYAHKNVLMENDVHIKGNSGLNFYQKIAPNYGKLQNTVNLLGGNINFLNAATEQQIDGAGWRYIDTDDDGNWDEKVWEPKHRLITFAQDFHVEDPNYSSDRLYNSLNHNWQFDHNWEVTQGWNTSAADVYVVLSDDSGNYILQDIDMFNWSGSKGFGSSWEKDSVLDAWDGTLGEGAGQFGQIANKTLPKEIGGKAFITAEFEAELQRAWSPVTPLITIRTGGKVGSNKSVQPVDYFSSDPYTVDTIEVEDSTVSWNGDWTE